jgi:hypothetical protein
MPAQTAETPVRAVGRYQLDTGGCRLNPADRAARGKAARTQVPRDTHYVRQLRDWKFSIEIESLRPNGLQLYGELCGWTLARHLTAGSPRRLGRRRRATQPAAHRARYHP